MERRLAPPAEQRTVLPPTPRPVAPPPPPPPPRPPTPAAAPPVVAASPKAPLLSAEEWVGQRGILAAGVILVILAAGFFLKFAFDRGWVSPAMRCIGGVIMGATTSAVGWRLHPRYRQYGAAIIGLGFGIVYLALWAASQVYALVPPGLDIASLTLVSLALTVVAYLLDEEALGAAAAIGALFAPIVMARGGSPDTLLLYLAMVGATLGAASVVKRWRWATLVVVLAMFGLGLVGAFNDATPWRVALFAMSGAAGIAAGLWARWPETRVLSFAGGWGLLAAAATGPFTWLVTIGGLVLAAPLWWHALRTSHIWPDHRGAVDGEEHWFLDETLPFYLTPVLLGWAIANLAPAWFSAHPGIAPFIVAAGYLAMGYGQTRYPFALVGAAAAAWATLAAWPFHQAVYVLLALSLLWAGLDHWLRRNDGRWYAAGTLAVAMVPLTATAGTPHGLAAVIVAAIAYFAVGDRQPRHPFALVGAIAIAWATLASWPSYQAVYVLLTLALLWAGLEPRLGRNDGRWYAAGTLAAAIVSLIAAGAARGSGPAFVDGWAGSLWFTTIVAGILANGAWMRLTGADKPKGAAYVDWAATRDQWATQMPAVLWTTAGVLLFAGVTGELSRFFSQSAMAPFEARLWSGLSISAWWATFAGALVGLGFRRNLRPVRIAGLIVAGITVTKVILVDLSTLDALYRVGSVFILGIVSLGVAFLYHRQAKPNS